MVRSLLFLEKNASYLVAHPSQLLVGTFKASPLLRGMWLVARILSDVRRDISISFYPCFLRWGLWASPLHP